ncbi:MAG: hypothetical protein AAGA54_14605 [Myxococcota bacterium]
MPTTPNLPARILDHEVSATLAETKRSGPWTPGVNTLVKATLAEIHLDFREAVLPEAHELCLDVEVLVGSVTVIVPPSWVVLQEVSLLVGSVEEDAEPVGPEPERVLRIIGRVRIGSVEVRRRLPGESWFGAKRRRWKLRRKATRALPPTS